MDGVDIKGFAAPKFDEVREMFAANLASGKDVGASFAVTLEGETVVDLWGGWADGAKARPWEKDTIVCVYSTTKTMTALTALLLADRGELNFDDPVAKYWPEFAANGKEWIKVAHLMGHTSGLSTWKEHVSITDLYDWEKATSLLAAQAPLWEPGSASGYHAWTQGYLVGEVVRRITGRSLGTTFREEIAEPLGADFHIGLAPEHDKRVADLIQPPSIPSSSTPAFVSELGQITFRNPPVNPTDTRTRAWREAEIPASGGHGNARSVAEIQAVLANGGIVGGKRLLSEPGCRKALEVQIEGTDLVLGQPVKFGLGFGLPDKLHPLPNPNTIYWGGYGGSTIVIDMDTRMTFSYVMNKIGNGMDDTRGRDLIAAAWRALSIKA